MFPSWLSGSLEPKTLISVIRTTDLHFRDSYVVEAERTLREVFVCTWSREAVSRRFTDVSADVYDSD